MSVSSESSSGAVAEKYSKKSGAERINKRRIRAGRFPATGGGGIRPGSGAALNKVRCCVPQQSGAWVVFSTGREGGD